MANCVTMMDRPLYGQAHSPPWQGHVPTLQWIPEPLCVVHVMDHLEGI